jgi:glycosyltransferase involved in cell wall biosynthesis
MDISLIICAHNEAANIGSTIDTARLNARGKFKEIVVVDNASTDATAEIARAHGARVVREDHKGLTAARQRGFEAVQSDFLAYIDADTLIPPEWIDLAERIFRDQPDAVSLSGPRRYFGAALWRLWVLNAVWGMAPLTYRAVGYMILGGNFIAKRAAIAQIGGFDRSIAFYGEDTDLARRLSAVGKTIFRMDFFARASARRFEAEGIVKPNIVYALNYLWPVLFHRPYTREYQDIR